MQKLSCILSATSAFKTFVLKSKTDESIGKNRPAIEFLTFAKVKWRGEGASRLSRYFEALVCKIDRLAYNPNEVVGLLALSNLLPLSLGGRGLKQGNEEL